MVQKKPGNQTMTILLKKKKKNTHEYTNTISTKNLIEWNCISPHSLNLYESPVSAGVYVSSEVLEGSGAGGDDIT